MSSPPPLTALTIEEFLDRAGARTPTPGGGSVSALAGALAVSMARMAGEYSMSKDDTRGSDNALARNLNRLQRLQNVLESLIDEDASAYRNLSEELKKERQGLGDGKALAEARRLALSVPMEIAAAAAGALAVLDEMKQSITPRLMSDLGVASVLANAAAESAAMNVRINLADIDPELGRKARKDIDEIISRSATLERQVTGYVEGRLQA